MVLNVVFTIEAALKLMGLGFRGYVADRFNIFDMTIVIIGLIEITFLEDDSGIIVLRAFRLLRIFKLARGWKSLRDLLTKIIETLPSIGYLGLLCLLCIFVYSLMGMQFFAGKLKNDEGELPRANFETIYWSFITIF